MAKKRKETKYHPWSIFRISIENSRYLYQRKHKWLSGPESFALFLPPAPGRRPRPSIIRPMPAEEVALHESSEHGHSNGVGRGEARLRRRTAEEEADGGPERRRHCELGGFRQERTRTRICYPTGFGSPECTRVKS